MRFKPAPDYDTWLLQGSGVDDEPGPPDEFTFCMKLRGGIVKVFCRPEYQDDSDEDGQRTILVAVVELVTWAFDEEFDLDLTWKEKQVVRSRAGEELDEVLNQ